MSILDKASDSSAVLLKKGVDDEAALQRSCPCGSGKCYAECCAPLHAGVAVAQTAEQLMRSRYSAYVFKLADYLAQTWAEKTRPVEISFEENLSWQKLTILQAHKGRAKDKKGSVTFCAEFQQGLERFRMTEKSRFERDKQGCWVYVDGEFY